MSGRFLICGEAVIDLFQDSGIGPLAFRGQPAGSPFNVAVGLARLGCPASFVTGLSRDAFGGELMAALAAEGVDTSLAPRTDRPTILSFVMVQPDGVPVYAFYGEQGADLQVRADHWPQQLPRDIDAIHLGGFPLAVDPSKAAYATLVARESGKRFISIDPNVRVSLMGDLAVYRQHLDHLAAQSDLIKISHEDIAHLYPGAAPEDIARHWLGGGVSAVILTDGPNGATAVLEGGSLHVPSASVAVVDTVGAGDSFMSALLAGLRDAGLTAGKVLRGIDPAALGPILAFANKAAGITCTRRGANPPTRAEVGRP
jgi:fructokinase